MSFLSRRTLLSAALGGFAGSVVAATRRASAQTYPFNRPIVLVIPWPPGGITDTAGRIIAARLSIELGHPVVVENRSGAAGTIGHNVVARANPDGHTLLLATNSTYAMVPYLYKNLPYDNEKAFTPIGLVMKSPQILCAHPSVPAKDIPSFLDYVRARQPGSVSFESSGPGSSSHLAMELFLSMTKTTMLHVPYRGGGPALLAIASSEINVGFVDAIVALPMADGGKIRLLGVSTNERMPLAPDLPTIAESGVPGFQSSTDVALFAPAKTPATTIQRISAALLTVLKSPELREQFKKLGVFIVGGSPDQFAAYYSQESAKWGEIIRSRGITMSQ